MDFDHLQAVYFASGVAGEAEKTERGTFIVRGVPIFKAGEFTDSAGKRRAWDSSHLHEIAENYNTLKDQGLFPNVPLRTGHDRSTDHLVGYMAGVSVDDEKNMLLGDLEFTEPEAYEKWKRGTYRSRSLEVGPYESNDERIFWPVAKGLAFVDIPAVEGLHSKSDVEKGAHMPPPETKESEKVTEKNTEHTFTIRGVPTQDVTSVQTYIDQLEEAAGKGPEAFEFTLPSGVKESDPAKVQLELDAQRDALVELDKAARKEFIEEMGKQNKVAASQIDGLVQFAQALDGDQWSAYRKTLEDAPEAAPVGPVATGGKGGGKTEPPARGDEAEFTEEERLEETVATFRRANVSEDKIKEMPSYKRLAEIKAAK